MAPASAAAAHDPVRDISVLIRSQYPLVFVESMEEERAEHAIVQAARACGHRVFVWSITRGLVDEGGTVVDPRTREVGPVLAAIERGAPQSVYVMLGFGEHMDDDTVRRMLLDFTRLDRQTIFVVGPSAVVHESLRVHSAVYNLPLPDHAAVEQRVRQLAAQLAERGQAVLELQEEQLHSFVLALRGLTMDEIDRIVSRLALEDGRLADNDIEVAVQAKAELLARSGVLELASPRHGLSDVAGFADLKEWIRTRGMAFQVDGSSLGLDPPKGFMLTGVPGCGKSFIVKALAREWNMPLLRLDAGALYDKFIGETERNLRSALATAEALSPSILWIDEIEKGFATTGPSTSDGGLGYRLVGTLATWMQERRQPVFVAATSNDITILPPELTRKGRFDEIFFVDLPGRDERAQVLQSQLRLRGLEGADVDCARLADLTDGFSGSELEQALVSALYSAVADRAQVDTGYIGREIARTRPLSAVSPQKIEAIRAWGHTHARLA